MSFEVQFWNDEYSQLHHRYFDMYTTARAYAERLKEDDAITSIQIKEWIWVFEREENEQ